MKKKILIGGIILIIAFAIGAMIYASITLKGKQNTLDDTLITLNYEEFQEKIDNKESFILVITRTTCSHCLEYKPKLKEVLAEYNLKAYDIETDTLTEEEENKLKAFANVSGTPTTVFVENGEEQQTSSRINGDATKDKIIARLKAMGYIKE